MTDTTWPYAFPESDVPEGMSPQQHELNLAQEAIDKEPAHIVTTPEPALTDVHSWTIDGNPIATPVDWQELNEAGHRPRIIINYDTYTVDSIVRDGDGNVIAANLTTP